MKKIDLTGQKFGKLVVLERSDYRSPRGKRTIPTWQCLCECGTITYKATDSLKGKGYHMCKRCQELYSSQKAREKAGFQNGTQITKLKNMKNTASNSSGVRGVVWDKRSNKWRARLTFQGKYMSFGTYEKFEDAVAARKAAEEEYYEPMLKGLEQINQN